jgi:hypothetical protein
MQEGWGDVHGSPLSPTRPQSMRRRQSLQMIDLETKLDQLASENRLLQDAKSKAERGLEELNYVQNRNENAAKEALETRDLQLHEKTWKSSSYGRRWSGCKKRWRD